jgi:hypothetical protein
VSIVSIFKKKFYAIICKAHASVLYYGFTCRRLMIPHESTVGVSSGKELQVTINVSSAGIASLKGAYFLSINGRIRPNKSSKSSGDIRK